MMGDAIDVLTVWMGSPLLGTVAFSYLVVGAGELANGKARRACVAKMAAGAIGLGMFSLNSGSYWLFPSALVFVGGGLYGLTRVGRVLGDSVPTVDTVVNRTADRGLGSVVGWLRATETTFSMPPHAVALVSRIREHVETCSASADRDAAADDAVSKMISGDMRDLLVRYRKVEAARKLLPGNAELGDAELVNGLVKIEQALIAQREAVAKRALHDLKVQARYIETKHDDGAN
jgi:hypothetical protein